MTNFQANIPHKTGFVTDFPTAKKIFVAGNRKPKNNGTVLLTIAMLGTETANKRLWPQVAKMEIWITT